MNTCFILPYPRWWTAEREEQELDDHTEARAGSSEESQLWCEILRQAGGQAEIGLSDAAKSSPGGNGEEELGAGHTIPYSVHNGVVLVAGVL